MKVTIAIDSFKGSISSLEAGESAKAGVLKVFPNAEIVVKPIADGGEGTIDALTSGMGGKINTLMVKNPLGELVLAEYGEVGDIAIIESAKACGITLIKKEQLNPMLTTTYGVGEIIKDAISKGLRKFIIGIGGSATNDCGIGMLSALGVKFLDKNGKEVCYGAKALKEIVKIDVSGKIKELNECKFYIACDVNNPLCGERGASKVYAKQKGASPEDIILMDEYMNSFADLTKTVYPTADKNAKGAGAAGGLGFAFMVYLNAALKSGIDLVLSETGLEDCIKDSNLVITGEGRIDEQTIMGKAPVGITCIAKKYGVPVVAFAGSVADGANVCNEYGIDGVFGILNSVTTLEDAMQKERAKFNLKFTVEQVIRAIKIKI